jgi:hypothetical protein
LGDELLELGVHVGEDRSQLGATPASEPEIAAGGAIPAACHVAKAGPRGATRDLVALFRRGFPFTCLTATGAIEAGLEFVSFQASMLQFITIRDQWMANNDFPQTGTGPDALFQNGLATVVDTGAFFVPALLGAYPGEGFFHPQPDDDRCLGYITVHKTVVNPDGTPAQTELGGFSFQLLDPAGTAVGNPFVTTPPAEPLRHPRPEASPTPCTKPPTGRISPPHLISKSHSTIVAMLIKVTNTAANSNPRLPLTGPLNRPKGLRSLGTFLRSRCLANSLGLGVVFVGHQRFDHGPA